MLGNEGINLKNKNNLTPLHNSVKKNKENALDFALLFNAGVMRKIEKKEEEKFILALRDKDINLPIDAFKSLVMRLDS